MDLESLGPDVTLAGEAVRDAARFIRTVKRDAVEYALAKANASSVRAADFVVQAFVVSRLAGSLLVEEAGGRVTDLDGLPLDFTTGRELLRNKGLVASNGLLHDAVLDVVRRQGHR